MDQVINSKSIETLCEETSVQSQNVAIPSAEKRSKQSVWNKIKTAVREVCEVVSPIVDLILAVCRAVSTTISAYGIYYKYRRA